MDLQEFFGLKRDDEIDIDLERLLSDMLSGKVSANFVQKVNSVKGKLLRGRITKSQYHEQMKLLLMNYKIKELKKMGKRVRQLIK